MRMNRHMAIVAIAAVVLAVPALGGKNTPVTRSIEGYAVAKWVVNPLDGTSTTEQTGEMSHLGAFVILGSGVWDLSTFTVISGSGVVIAANRDQVFWDLDASGPYQIVCDGGTGRFEGCTGGLNSTRQTAPVVTIDPATGNIVIELSYTFAGTLTY